jgi:hypothetical protein
MIWSLIDRDTVQYLNEEKLQPIDRIHRKRGA